MGRWLALLSTAAVIIAVAAIDPCKRQPFRGRCPSVGGAPPKRSQFVLRYYARNGECVSYPYGHCATDESEPQLYRYKEECEDSCINNTPANLGQPKSASEDNQTYGTPSPTKENPVAAGQRIFTPIQSKEPVIEKETTVTAPPTTVTTTDSTTTVTTTEATTTAQKVTITEEPTTTKVTIITTEATTESPTTTTHATTQSVTETTEGEEEEVEEQEEVQETTAPAPTTSKSTVTTASSARTECERRREASSSSKIRGGFVPVCDANGNFQKAQCEPDGRQCFCVNTSGIEITNSRTRNGVRPDCARIETAVAPKIQSCTGRPDRGPCSSSYTRYYYDEYTQRCTTFSYSGCGGTGNNYETDSECSTRCVPTKPPVVTTVAPTTSQHNDICLLPKERGPCDKYELRFYFNGETKECKYFFWGGCEGNGNNFETAEQCQSQCGVGKVSQHNLARTVSQTNGAIKTIPGVRIGNGTATTGSLPEIETAAPTTSATTTTQAPRTAPPTVPTTRFVPQTVQTRAPVPVQTQPPQTRFVPQTTAAPQPPPTATPVAPPRPPPVNLPGDSEESDVNRCDHPVDSGSCRGQFVRWFWDNNKQACDVFTYSGCEGNGNNFANREECMAICQRELPPPPQPPKDFSNVCKHEIDSGECQGVFQRFAFDTEEGECRPFTYGGCGGNGNNFATIAECRSNCEKPASQTVNVCEFDIEAGECTGVFPRFAYDRETNDCRPFTYGGCGGNGNNFATVNECRNICIKKTCNPIGQCDLSHCQVLTDSRGCRFCSCAPVKVPTPLQCPTIDVNRCLEPCIVMTNRRGCQECACPAQPSTLQPPVVLSRVPSPPAPSTQQPRPPGLPTRIEPPSAPSRPGENLRTIPGVEPNKSLLPADFAEDIQEKCLQPMATGPCKSFTDRWFFNKEDGSCHPFKYGGCAGNRNHFFTQRECQIHCARFLREASAEDSFEDQEPVRRPVAHGVSHVRVVEPLPVENYQSPEPALRGSYGKKYLEPVTTQGVKITSTARSTTTTTTPTTTTVRTTTKIQEKDESVEEEEPQEITTVSVPSSSTSTTTEVPKKEDKPVEVNETEESSAQEPQESQVEQQPQEAKRFEAQSEQTAPETKEKDEPEAIAETSTELPASRAARLLEQAGKNEKEPEKTEEEEEEEVDETDETAVFTDGTTTEKATDPATATEKPTVGTTLLNEISSMEGEEGVEENEITPSSMMSSSKFAVHRQTEEAQKFEEITADLAGSPVKEVNTARPGLIRVEITRPPTLPSTAPAPTAESAPETAATQAESAATEESTTAEASPSPSTQTKTQNIEITDSTSSVSSPATTQVPSTASTTQSRPVTTASDSDDNEPTFDLNSIKSNINPRVEGVVQQPTEAVINPAVGVGREPVPRVPLLPAVQAIDPKKLDLEEPTTIFPTTKAVPTSNKPFNSRDPKIVCSMPAEQGLCNSYVARWFFNYQTAQCEEFSFGGCGGNANNFVNRTLCELTCRSLHPSVTTLVPERCSYDKDAGEGRGYNVKWYFNMRNLRCEQFVYEGKGGNDNKFETLSDCERFCSPQPARPASSRPAPITPATVLPTKAETLRPASLPVAPSVIAPTFNKPLPGAPAPIAPTAAPKANPLVPLPATNEDSEDQEDTEDTEYSSDDEDPTMGPMPPLANRAQLSSHGPNELVPTPEPPATEPHPPSARGSKLEIVDRPHPVPVQPTVAFTTAAPTTAKATETPTTPSPTYNAKKIDNSDMVPREPNLGIVGPSPKEDVNYQTGQQPKASGIQTFDEKRLPPPDLDAKNEDDKVIRPSCPNGNKELHYSDGRPVMCLPGKAQCPDKAMCYFNGMDYFCCPNEEDPYDRHIFGGYGGDEARYGYKVFGPLRISRLMDEVPLRAKRQTTMDRAFNTNQASFNIDSVTAPLRFDAEKPRHVSSASRMRKPVPPKHGNPMCILPLVKGDCGAAHLRYYYDRNSDSCRLFYYSGCQGNANNFGSLSDCQRLCVLNGQVAPAVQADAVTPVTIIAPGQCPTGSPLGGNAPVLCGNSTDSIGCPTGFYCRGGPPDICCPGVDPAIRVVQHGVKLLPETTPLPGVPRSYYKQQLLATPRYMCPDASDPLMAENGSPAVCGAGFDFKMCPKGYYCAIDGAKGSRLCCPLFGSTASRIPHEYNVIPNSPLKASSTSREVSDREAIPRDQARYDQEQQKELIQHPATTTEEPEEEEYEDDDAAQQLRLKNDSHNSELQQNAAAESPKAADVSAEVVNIDIPKEEPAVEESTQPTETVKKPVSDKSVCLMKPTEGRACREDEKAPRTNLHYFYSAKDRRCKLYFYRGCGGNDNRFEKKGDCEALCLSV